MEKFMITNALSKIFKLSNGLASNKVEISNKKRLGFIPYQRPSKTMIGTIAGYVDRNKVDSKYIFKNAIAVSTDGEGSHTYSYYFNYEFIPNSNVLVLTPYEEMTELELKVYASIITSNRYKFQYGRKPKEKRLENITVPILEEVKLIIKSNNLSNLTKLSSNPSVDENSLDKNVIFRNFKIKELFKVSGTKTTSPEKISKLSSGEYPYITTKNDNNGVDGFYNIFTENGKCLTIDSATVGAVFYQDKNFIASDHVEKLVPIDFSLNKYIGLYFVTLIRMEMYRYGYGRKFNQGRIKETIVQLPCIIKNELYIPDLNYMENYIKSLEFSDSI